MGVFDDIVRALYIISAFPRPRAWPVTPPSEPSSEGGLSEDQIADCLTAWRTCTARQWADVIPAAEEGREAMLAILEDYFPNPFCTADLKYAAKACWQDRMAAATLEKAAKRVPYGANLNVAEVAGGNAFNGPEAVNEPAAPDAAAVAAE